jgi:hypothetical protein
VDPNANFRAIQFDAFTFIVSGVPQILGISNFALP